MNDEYKKKVLNNLINKIGKPFYKRKKEPLPPHVRTELWQNKLLIFVLKHGLTLGNNFIEFERKFKNGEIPKEYIDKITKAMRRADEQKKERYKNKK
ncbi:MAG TPA: hypothetical protein DHV22_14515 [Xanthomarina gelatinilytica]|uniref:Uncharacterized protein n=1 Tax=Xanthomarina gelatinilytica TaxID=1137281 RepID=A0A3D6BU21_9FLAO|nr:hypothetical protein [Xanthomarina gelatinilytica]